MFERRIPEWVRHAPAPGAAGFGVLAALDAAARGLLLSVFPIVIYRAFGDPAAVSRVLLMAGIGALTATMLVPWLLRYVRRVWMFSAGALSYAASASVAIAGGPEAAPAAYLLYTVGSVTVFVCLNAYVLDYIARAELGRCETLRLFYSALAWCVGPALGVWLQGWWYPAPFIGSGLAGLCLLAAFLYMRLGNGKLIRRARGPAPNPVAYLGRFARQPRLIAGWLFAVLRSSGWWVYIVFLPIYAIENGLGDKVGGVALSITNGLLFVTPLMLAWMQRRSVRRAVRTGFMVSGLLFFAAAGAAVSGWPWAAVALLFAASAFMILLDISAGLPFLLAVKPSERTEMSAVYSSYRDVSGILTPAAAWAVLLVAPLPGIFVAGGVGLLAAWGIAGRLHPRLGHGRIAPAPPLVPREAGAVPGGEGQGAAAPGQAGRVAGSVSAAPVRDAARD